MGDLGKLIVAKGFKKFSKVQKIAQSGHTGCYLSPSNEFIVQNNLKRRWERCIELLKNGQFRPLLLYFVFLHCWHQLKIFAYDWKQTGDLWCQKEPLYHLCHLAAQYVYYSWRCGKCPKAGTSMIVNVQLKSILFLVRISVITWISLVEIHLILLLVRTVALKLIIGSLTVVSKRQFE